MENMEIGEDQPWDGIYGMEIQILRWPETPFPSRALRSWGTEATAKGARRWALEYSATAKGYLPWGEKVLATPCYLRVPLMLRPHRFFRALWCDDAKVSTKQGEAKVARPTTGSSGNDHPNMTGFRLSFYGETKAVLRLEKKKEKNTFHSLPLPNCFPCFIPIYPDSSPRGPSCLLCLFKWSGGGLRWWQLVRKWKLIETKSSVTGYSVAQSMNVHDHVHRFFACSHLTWQRTIPILIIANPSTHDESFF